jgi:hypothetical protein
VGSTPTPGTVRGWLGRQLDDHRHSECRMLWVRLPPEPLKKLVATVTPSTARRMRGRSYQRPCRGARSPRGPVTAEIAGSNPARDASTARYANRHSDQAQTLVPASSTLARATGLIGNAGEWDHTGAVNLVRSLGGSIPHVPTGAQVAPKGPFVYRLGSQFLTLKRGVRFPYGLLT